jgi:hypothetical protein
MHGSYVDLRRHEAQERRAQNGRNSEPTANDYFIPSVAPADAAEKKAPPAPAGEESPF